MAPPVGEEAPGAVVPTAAPVDPTTSSEAAASNKPATGGLARLTLTPHLVPAEHIPMAAKHEEDGYPADEAASLEKLQWRQENAPEFFLGVYEGGATATDEDKDKDTHIPPSADSLLGFVTSTMVTGPLTEEAMGFVHDSNGDNLCIHSVCVAQKAQRRGVGRQMMKLYHVKQHAPPSLRRISLICKQHLVGFYESAGFKLIGPSAVQHGEDEWFDMDLEISS